MNASLEQKKPRDTRLAVRRTLRWVAILIALLFFGNVLIEALFPYGDKGYIEITHGDHAHFVPENRNPNVSVSNFPTRPPGPDERITPDGRIVPK